MKKVIIFARECSSLAFMLLCFLFTTPTAVADGLLSSFVAVLRLAFQICVVLPAVHFNFSPIPPPGHSSDRFDPVVVSMQEFVDLLV